MYRSSSSSPASSCPISYSRSSRTPWIPLAAPSTRVMQSVSRAVRITPSALALMTAVGPPDCPMMQAPLNSLMNRTSLTVV